MLNNADLKQKLDDMIKLLGVYSQEVDSIEADRKSLEQKQTVNTQREDRLTDLSKSLSKRETDLWAQQKHIEELNKNTSFALAKIVIEKEELKKTIEDKRTIDQERLQLEADKKGFDGLKSEKELLLKQRTEFEAERKLFAREKLAMIEAQKLLLTREENIKAKEERLDKIERMTSV